METSTHTLFSIARDQHDSASTFLAARVNTRLLQLIRGASSKEQSSHQDRGGSLSSTVDRSDARSITALHSLEQGNHNSLPFAECAARLVVGFGSDWCQAFGISWISHPLAI